MNKKEGQLLITATNVHKWNTVAFNNPNISYIINQGGSRSSKSWSICQILIQYCLTNNNKIVSIVRKTFPTIRGTVMRDFLNIMRDSDLYNEKRHNKTENIYTFPDTNSKIEFFSADEEQKLRGRTRNILWINESNEISYDEFNQLNMRTTDKIFLDYNPSENSHWVYELLSNKESILIKSTYKDNPFVGDRQIRVYEGYKELDENYYRIYTLGERGISGTTIYTHWKHYEELPEIKETYYGMDFGYNHYTALIEVNVIENTAYCKEIIYKTGLTVGDLINLMNELNISKKKEIICDTSRPEIIEDLRRSGFNAKNANKNVKEGIDSVKSTELYIHKESINLIKEIQSYKWKTNGDKILDEPVKIEDDICDALRYAIHYYKLQLKKPKPSYRLYH